MLINYETAKSVIPTEVVAAVKYLDMPGSRRPRGQRWQEGNENYSTNCRSRFLGISQMITRNLGELTFQKPSGLVHKSVAAPELGHEINQIYGRHSKQWSALSHELANHERNSLQTGKSRMSSSRE
jgi:hypothetical protein